LEGVKGNGQLQDKAYFLGYQGGIKLGAIQKSFLKN